jgi:hypothetical protein
MSRYLISYTLNPSKQPDDPKASYEAMKVAMGAADELMEAGIFKHHWSTGPASGVIIAKFPSFEEAYAVGNRFWPGISLTIQEILSWDKVKEIALSQAKEAAEQ